MQLQTAPFTSCHAFLSYDFQEIANMLATFFPFQDLKPLDRVFAK